ncbi:glycosyltransferase 61 family protein [Mesorhizobium sp. M0053]|uniref:glycosyltransferase family 61 protein n=1 Tax=Mesorhizobium sp. M0053 TaxID=2956864 RepID=UPI00333BDFDC
MNEITSLGNVMSVARPPHTYERIAPNLFNFYSKRTDLRQYVIGEISKTVRECPEEGVWQVSNAVVFDGKHVMLSDGRLAAETLQDTGQDHIASLGQRQEVMIDLRKLAANPYPIVILLKEGDANYGHMLVEMIPKLLSVKRLGIRAVNVVFSAPAEWAAELVVAIARTLEIEVNLLRPGPQPAFADELTILSPVARHNNRKSYTVVDMADHLLRSLAEPQPTERAEKLVVWRRPGEKRNPINSDELIHTLAGKGYRVVYPAEMSFRDQVAMFSKATHVVGLLGAGLTNTMFSPADTEVFMIDPGLYDFFFWDLCTIRKQNFSWYFSQPLQMFEPSRLTKSVELNTHDILSALSAVDFI